ncbi:MAG: prsT, partial [Massilia sp.]|nr:prsT [Massilia sp.]
HLVGDAGAGGVVEGARRAGRRQRADLEGDRDRADLDGVAHAQPQARDIRYHMAMGLFKAGDKAAARKELETLVAGNMKFAQADEARALLKQLQ